MKLCVVVCPAGLKAYEGKTGQLVLQTHELPKGLLKQVQPFVTRGVELYHTRALPQVTDGRASGGPVDLAAHLAIPAVQQQVPFIGSC